MISTVTRAGFLSALFFIAACSGASSEGGDSAGAKAPGDSSKVERNNDMVMGDENAPLTVIEYASVTCPHCAAFHETIFPEIKKNYVDTGKVKFIFREFPTPPQGLSYAGSVLARCAAEKGGDEAYFLVLNSLFKTQHTWISENAQAELKKIAAQAGMDEGAFTTCIQRQDLVDLINDNVKEGSEKYEVNATPTFVVNGEKLPGVRSVEDMSGALDKALAAKAG